MELGEQTSLSLPGFHVISGCDTTGCLKGKGKLSYYGKVFEAASDELIVAFAEFEQEPPKLITSDHLT